MGKIIRTVWELDGMDVDLAFFADSARQDLAVHVNFMWIPAQALEELINYRMTLIFIIGPQGSVSWPVHVILVQLHSYWKNNLNTEKKMTSHAFY